MDGNPQVVKTAKAEQEGATIVYDGGCPFCTAYVRLVRLREAIGPVRLVDAREGGPVVDEIVAAKLDLDDGMVLKLDGLLYHGDECLNRLALLSTSSGAFNRINVWMFRNPLAARLAYPVLRAGRNLALRLLGRQKLDIAKPPAPV
jgi:predicted DCC family thiol-disulfide oxidoreductase YuxK